MKNKSKPVYAVMMVLMAMGFFMSGCIERRYQREHHDHSPEWHHRHDRREGVDINIHN